MSLRAAAFSVFAVALAAQMSTAFAGESYAFLVSVKEYDEKELRPLEYTRNDILEFHQTLRSSGIREEHIVLMHDDVRSLENRKYLPEAAKIRQQLKLLLEGLDDGDSVIVAFAGHGVQFKGDSQNYFCPADAKLADRRTLISIQEIYGELKASRATRKLLLVDACRNDPQSNISRARSTVDLESVTRPQREKLPDGIVALFSCSPGQQSYEHQPLQHGVFFHHVLKGWNGDADNDRDGQVTFDEVASYTKRETTTYARRQLDVVQTPHLLSDFSGDWVLRRTEGVKPVEARRFESKPAESKFEDKKPIETKTADVPPTRFRESSNDKTAFDKTAFDKSFDDKSGHGKTGYETPAPIVTHLKSEADPPLSKSAVEALHDAEARLADGEAYLKRLYELYSKNAVSKLEIAKAEDSVNASRRTLDAIRKELGVDEAAAKRASLPTKFDKTSYNGSNDSGSKTDVRLSNLEKLEEAYSKALSDYKNAARDYGLIQKAGDKFSKAEIEKIEALYYETRKQVDYLQGELATQEKQLSTP